jgi:glycosyltransferase involved in cell wall biosynthesis
MSEKVCLLMWTLNEEHNLPITLALLKPFVDEIVIVDAMSNDRTRFIEGQFGAKVVMTVPTNVRNDAAYHRNLGLVIVESDWVLILDGDEFPLARLCVNLKELVHTAEDDKFEAIAVSRLNYTSGVLHNDKPGEDSLDYHIRLVKKHLRYAGEHSEGIAVDSAKTLFLNYKIYHCKSIDRGIIKHEYHRKLGIPVFPFPDWFAKIFGVKG